MITRFNPNSCSVYRTWKTARGIAALGVLATLGVPSLGLAQAPPASATPSSDVSPEAGDAWTKLQPHELNQLARKLKAEGKLSESEMAVGYALTHHVLPAVRDPEVPLNTATGVVAAWADLLSDAQKASVHAPFHQRFMEANDELTKLPFVQLYSYFVWDGIVGAKPAELSVVAQRWTSGGDAWRSCASDELYHLTTTLRGDPAPEAQELAGRVTAHAIERDLTGAGAQNLTPADWIKLVSLWAPQAGPAQREAIKAAFTSALLDRPERLKPVPADELLHLEGAWLHHLQADVAQDQRLLLSWLRNSELWQQGSTVHLFTIASKLDGITAHNKSQEAADGRDRLRHHVWQTRLSRADAEPQVPLTQYLADRMAWSTMLGSEQKARVREIVAARWASDAKITRSATADEALQVAACLTSLEAPAAQATDALRRWLEASDAWRSSTKAQTAALLAFLRRDPEGHKALAPVQELATSYWNQSLGDTAALHRATPSDVVLDVITLAPAVTPELRDKAKPTILARLGRPETVKALSHEELDRVWSALDRLQASPQEAAEWTAAWVEAHDAGGAPIATLSRIGQQLQGSPSAAASKARATASAKIAERVSDAAAWKQDAPALLAAIHSSVAWMSQDDKARLGSALDGVLHNEDVLAATSPEGLGGLLTAATALSVPKASIQTALERWVSTSPAWASLDPLDQASAFAGLLAAAPPGSPVRQRIVGKLLPNDDPKKRIETASLPTLAAAASAYANHLTAGERERLAVPIAHKLEGIDADKERAAFVQALSALVALDQRQTATQAMLRFIEQDPKRIDASSDDLLELASGLLVGDSFTADQAKLAKLVREPWIARTQRSDTFIQHHMAVVRWYMASRDRQGALAHTQRLYRQLLVDNTDYTLVSADDLFDLGVCILYCEPETELKPKPGYPRFGEALALRLKELRKFENSEGLWSAAHIFASPLASPEARRPIEAKLNSPDLAERLAAKRLLTVVHLEHETLNQWQAELDAQLRDPKLTGDWRAEVLLVRAFAVELQSLPPSPLGAKSYLDEAIASAESPQMRLICSLELVERYAFSRETQQAQAILDSLAGQLEGEQSRERVAQMRERIQMLAGYHASAGRSQQDIEERRRLEGQLAMLEGQLRSAQERKDAAENLASLRRMVEATKAELSELP